MKRLNLILICLIGICSMNAQNIPDLVYFKVAEKFEKYIVLDVLSLPEPEGNSGKFYSRTAQNPECMEKKACQRPCKNRVERRNGHGDGWNQEYVS